MSAIPSFVIIGAQKSGTTAAARNLSLHPNIHVFSGTTEYGQKELEFYNQHWERGTAWYASHFADGPKLNGEKTAELFHRTVCHPRLHAVNPNFKLIVLLRSPVDRAYSQWKMAKLTKRDEDETFEDIVARELRSLEDEGQRDRFYRCHDEGRSCWREGYLLKGMYAEQLRSLFEWFPRKQVFIGISERIRSNLSEGYSQIFEFLDVPHFEAPFTEHFPSRPAPPLSPIMRRVLTEVYREPNKQLSSLLGINIPEWA
jgi:hypothetical protein